MRPTLIKFASYFCTASLTLAKQLLFLLLAIILSLASCNNKKAKSNPTALKSGTYEIRFNAGEVEIPVRLRIMDNGTWCIHNWEETIILDSIRFDSTNFHVKMPLFQTTLDGLITSDSTFSGTWTDHTRDTLYQISFAAQLVNKLPASCDKETARPGDKRVYEVTFSPEIPEDMSKAVGIFYSGPSSMVGTFLTESGDYRFLEGTNTGQSIELSSFDGAHLFYFCANVENDKLTHGKFYSGNHWQEEWTGFINPNASLRDPDSLTFVQNKTEPLKVCVRNLDGDSICLDKSTFENKVTVIQIFGSWCPNCTDESIFMKELYSQYHTQGLEIIPVAFERVSEFEVAREAVVRQFTELGLEYKPYFGGQANKGNASKVFSSLSKITSYPTTIFVDKKGIVRKIHTGFNGPGTEEHYEKHTKEMSDFIASLLAENK